MATAATKKPKPAASKKPAPAAATAKPAASNKPEPAAATPKPAASKKPAPAAGTQLTCPECGKTFTRAASLGAHRQRAHGIAGTSQNARSRRTSKRRRHNGTNDRPVRRQQVRATAPAPPSTTTRSCARSSPQGSRPAKTSSPPSTTGSAKQTRSHANANPGTPRPHRPSRPRRSGPLHRDSDDRARAACRRRDPRQRLAHGRAGLAVTAQESRVPVSAPTPSKRRLSCNSSTAGPGVSQPDLVLLLAACGCRGMRRQTGGRRAQAPAGRSRR